MGLAKGRAFSAKRSVGHFRVGSVPSAIPKKCEITMEGMYLQVLLVHKKLAFDCTAVGSENILSRKLHVAVKKMLRHIQEFSLLLQMLITAESSTAVADENCFDIFKNSAYFFKCSQQQNLQLQ